MGKNTWNLCLKITPEKKSIKKKRNRNRGWFRVEDGCLSILFTVGKLSHDGLVTVNGILVFCQISLIKVPADVLLEVISFGVFLFACILRVDKF